ncbi:hypothetical protein LTS18_001245, partial [Coniosporium uncinatum]
MRKTITDAFDPKVTGKASDRPSNLKGGDGFEKADFDISRVDVEEQDKRRKAEEQREKELSTPKMRELREACILFFDDWRDNVLQRVGEVVNSKEQAKAHKREARPTSPESSSKRLSQTSEKHDQAVTETLHELYPPVDTPLAKMPQEQKALILHSMLLLLLSLESYTAHSRILLLYLTSSLHLPIDLLTEDEANTSRALLQAAEKMSADDETKKKAEENHSSRKWKVGLAGVAGAAVIGITGGLAAPLLAAGVGSVMGGLGLGATAAAGYLGTLASSTVLVGGLFGAYGGRMTGQMMDQYA